jgi:hypothetical protein
MVNLDTVFENLQPLEQINSRLTVGTIHLSVNLILFVFLSEPGGELFLEAITWTYF